jgi:hypothetical protein
LFGANPRGCADRALLAGAPRASVSESRPLRVTVPFAEDAGRATPTRSCSPNGVLSQPFHQSTSFFQIPKVAGCAGAAAGTAGFAASVFGASLKESKY